MVLGRFFIVILLDGSARETVHHRQGSLGFPPTLLSLERWKRARSLSPWSLLVGEQIQCRQVATKGPLSRRCHATGDRGDRDIWFQD